MHSLALRACIGRLKRNPILFGDFVLPPEFAILKLVPLGTAVSIGNLTFGRVLWLKIAESVCLPGKFNLWRNIGRRAA